MSFAAALVAGWLWSSLAVAGPAGRSPDGARSTDTAPDEPATGAVTGRVRARGERRPLPDARVVIIPAAAADGGTPSAAPPWSRGARTDAEGRFTVKDVPAEAAQIIVLSEGHERAEHAIVVVAGATVSAELFVTVDEARYRTVVETRRATKDVRPPSTLLSREEADTLPGTQGDALRALQSLPGVARPPAGLGFIVLRGAPPGQSLTLLGEHPVPRAFHALPLAGIVPTAAIEEIEMTPSNASVRYGNLMGGVVRIEPRRPKSDELHGLASLDVAGAQAAMYGPVGRGHFFAAARRGWADLVLDRATSVTEIEYLRPGLWDYQAWAAVDHRRATFTVRAFGVGDRVRLDGYDGERQLDYRAQFHRLDFVARVAGAKSEVLLTPTVRFQDDASYGWMGAFLRRREVVPGWRAEATVALPPALQLVIGTDGQVSPWQASFQTPQFPSPEEAPPGVNFSGTDVSWGSYAMLSWQRPGLRITPGLRAQGVRTDDALMAQLDPRVTARWDPRDDIRVDLGAGRYSQAIFASSVQYDPASSSVFSALSDDIVLPSALRAAFEPVVARPDQYGPRWARAWHGSATITVSLPRGIELRGTGFFRHVRDPGFPGGGGQITQNPSRGFDAGGELLLRKRLTRKLHGWIAYTGMRSVRWQDGRPRRRADFDQPHNLLAVASYRLPRGWRIGGRFRLASGNPFTPIVGVVQVPSRASFSTPPGRPLYGTLNSDRFPLFHQLDLRIDKTWTRARAKIRAYLDIQNIYNQGNVEAWRYYNRFRSRAPGFGLPIFPTLGVRVDL